MPYLKAIDLNRFNAQNDLCMARNISGGKSPVQCYPLVTTLWSDPRLFRQSVTSGSHSYTRALQQCFEELAKTRFLHFGEFCQVKLRVRFRCVAGAKSSRQLRHFVSG